MISRRTQWSAILAGVMLASGVAWAGDASSAVGRWGLTIGSGERTHPSWIGITMKDGKLHGSFVGGWGSVSDIGEVKFDNGTLEWKRGDETYKAKLDGDKLAGELVGKDGKGTRLVGKKVSLRPDVNGTWNVKVTTPRGEQPWKLVLHDDGKAVTGYRTGRNGQRVEISDAALDDAGVLTFRLKRRTQNGGEVVVQHTVRVMGDKIEGTFKGRPNAAREQKWVGQREREWGEPIKLINGKDLDGWKEFGNNPGNWKVENGELVNTRGGANIMTTREFTDFKLHVEFNVPKDGNSGVYLRGRYEVQIADNYGRPPDEHGCGAIYSRLVPPVNASLKPGEWQTYDITLIGRYVTVVHNGKMLYDNVEIEGITGGAIDSHENSPGPLYLQGDHSALRYRNVVLTPAKPPGKPALSAGASEK